MLEQLTITRATYGEDKGQLRGRIKISTQAGAVELTLTEEQAQGIIDVVADTLIDYSKMIANDMTVILVENGQELLEHST